MNRPDFPPLTKRQAQVLRLMAEGLTYTEIARRMGLRIGTVRTHIGDLFDILHVSNRTEAVILALGSVVDAEETQAAVMARCWGDGPKVT